MKREEGCQIAMKLVDIGVEYEHSATATMHAIRSNPEWSNIWEILVRTTIQSTVCDKRKLTRNEVFRGSEAHIISHECQLPMCRRILTLTMAFHMPYLVLPNSTIRSPPCGVTFGCESVGWGVEVAPPAR